MGHLLGSTITKFEGLSVCRDISRIIARNCLDDPAAIDYGTQQLNGTYGTGALDALRGVPGRVGTAAQFGDQSTVFLSAPDIGGDWSAEFVLKRIGTKLSSALIRGIPFAFPSQALKLEQYWNTEQIGYTKYGIVDATFSPAASSPLNEWIHIVYVNQAAADRVHLYVNGVLAGTRIDHFDLPRDQIGSWSDNTPESPLALMDEVVLYNRALSPAEIAVHYAAVPEPSTAAFAVLAGFGALTGLQVRRQKSDYSLHACLVGDEGLEPPTFAV
jgi:hypothetical protein